MPLTIHHHRCSLHVCSSSRLAWSTATSTLELSLSARRLGCGRWQGWRLRVLWTNWTLRSQCTHVHVLCVTHIGGNLYSISAGCITYNVSKLPSSILYQFLCKCIQCGALGVELGQRSWMLPSWSLCWNVYILLCIHTYVHTYVCANVWEVKDTIQLGMWDFFHAFVS